MIEFTHINHIHVCVPEERLDDAKEFYTSIIGLELIYRPDVFPMPGYWLAIGNVELHIGIEPFLGRSIRHSAFEVADIAAARAHLQQNNVEITEEPVIPGRTRFAFIDPFGNRMELLQIIDG